MPFEQMISPTPVVWHTDVSYPNHSKAAANPEADSTLTSEGFGIRMGNEAGAPGTSYNAAGVGGAGVTKQQLRINGLWMRQVNNTAAGALSNRTDAWVFPQWLPLWTPSGWAAGAGDDEDCRIAWFRIWLHTTTPVMDTDDATGVSFIAVPDAAAAALPVTNQRANQAGGFGIFQRANGAGTGVTQWRFSSYSQVPALITSTNMPLDALTGSLHTADFIIRAGVAGGAAPWLTMRWDGVDVLTQEPFGGPLLTAFATLSGNAVHLAMICHATFTAATGARIHYRWRFRQGRFHPDGFPV